MTSAAATGTRIRIGDRPPPFWRDCFLLFGVMFLKSSGSSDPVCMFFLTFSLRALMIGTRIVAPPLSRDGGHVTSHGSRLERAHAPRSPLTAIWEGGAQPCCISTFVTLSFPS